MLQSYCIECTARERWQSCVVAEDEHGCSEDGFEKYLLFA